MADIKMKAKSLLDDDDDQNLGATALGIRVNKEYAARFEHNKRREELHRLQSKYPEEAEKLARKIAREAAKAAGEQLPPEDDDKDSSENEEEDEGEIPSDTEAKIFDTLLRIRSQHPSIYQKDVHFFKDEDEEDGGQEEQAGSGPQKVSKKAKALYLKDLIAKQALEYGPGGDSSDEEAGDRKLEKRHPKAYDPEQEVLRKAFLHAAGEADEGEGGEGDDELAGVLRLRSKTDDAGGDADGKKAGQDGSRKTGKKGANKGGGQAADGQFQQLIEAYFGTDVELNPDDKFLKEYIVNKGWVDREDDYVPSYQEIVGEGDERGAGGEEGLDDDDDERYLREVDAFEAKYNFRFEEPGADRIITHPRVVEGTVRKPDDKRKRQRDTKKQRLEEAEAEAREEVKRLKNLKKQEIESKLEKLRHVAGAAAPAAASLDNMLEGDFDPEEWDKKMAAAFDDKYYEVEEDLEHLADDLDLLGGDAEDTDDDDGVHDDEEGGEGKQLRFRKIRKKLREVDALSEEPEDGEDGRKKGSDPEAVARQRADLQRLLEEYYKLDYEDNIGGLKTRFRYKEVPASTFGLTMDEILRLDDKALNRVVGMKRLAPYREDLSKLRPNYKALEMIKGEMANTKGQRRVNRKRDWQKSRREGGPGRKPWREEGGPDEAVGLGPSSAAAQQPAGGHSGRQPQQDLQEAPRKRKDRGADDSDMAGPGPGSEAEAGQHKKAKKAKAQGGEEKVGGAPARQGGGKHEKSKDRKKALDPKQARLASYAVPTLKKEPGGSHSNKSEGKKRKRTEGKHANSDGAVAQPSEGAGLTRAQRKNLKRSQKRASKREAERATSTG